MITSAVVVIIVDELIDFEAKHVAFDFSPQIVKRNTSYFKTTAGTAGCGRQKPGYLVKFENSPKFNNKLRYYNLFL